MPRQRPTHRPRPKRRPSRLSRELRRLALFPWIGTALLLALLMGADTDAGRTLLARALNAAGSGQVVVHGLGGELPFNPRIARLELTDGQGVWLRASDVSAALRPASLLRGELDLHALTAHRLELLRLPGTAVGKGARSSLPVRVRSLVIAQLALDVPSAPVPPLAVTGTAAVAGAQADAELLLTVPGRTDRYRLTLAPDPQGHDLAVTVSEAADGPLARLARSAGLPLPPGFADWTLDARARGPLAATAVNAEVASGAYRASLNGVLDLPSGSLSALEGTLEAAPVQTGVAGTPGALGWGRLTARAELSGPLRSPRGAVSLAVEELVLSRVADPVVKPQAQLAGSVQLEGRFDLARGPWISGLLVAAPTRVPEPWGTLLGPRLHLSLSAERDGALWTIDDGQIGARLFDLELAGRAGDRALDLSWALDLQAPAALTRGAGVALSAQGRMTGRPLAPGIEADLAIRRIPLAVSTPGQSGGSAAPGEDASGGQVHGTLRLEPTAPRGTLVLQGRWLGEPVGVDVALDPMPGGGLDLRLGESRWSGIALTGRLGLAGDARLPTGAVQLRVARLEEVAPLLMAVRAGRAQPPLDPDADWSSRLGGRLEARLELAGDDRLRLLVDGAGLRLPFGVSLAGLALDGELQDPFGRTQSELRLRLSDLSAAELTGDVDLRAHGPLDACELEAGARLSPAGPGGARLAAAGRLDARARRLMLHSLTLDAHDRRLQLLAPADVDLGTGVTLDSTRLGFSSDTEGGPGGRKSGVLILAGQIAPRLSLDARIADLHLDAVAPWLPWIPAGLDGVLGAETSLAGSLGAPTGRVSLAARGLALAPAARLGLPPAEARLSLTLERAAAQLAAEGWIDERARLVLDGRIGGAVWSASAPLDLRGRGHLDLALLDPWLGAGGRRAEGRVGLETGITGTRSIPQLDGRLRIASGAWRDPRLGLWLDDIDGSARLDRDHLRIERLVAKSGAGTLALDGDVGWLAPGQPVDLRLRARRAEPIRLDLLRLRGDADLALRGALAGDLGLSGDMRFDRVDIRVPQRMPRDVPTLDVVERGERRQPRPLRRAAPGGAWPSRLLLDVRLEAPRAVRVRGQHIDAELGGGLRLHGSAGAPVADGGFALVRGEYELIGQPLRFDRGRIGLDGAHLLDPTLDFEARAQSPGGTAILSVEGRARAPRVGLRGEPPMSDEEVLSRLLFGVAPGRLSAFQLTRLGLAAASLAGLGGDGSGLLERAHAGLGLDGLRIESDRRGEAVLEGGRDLTERVYLGARQGVAGGEPRAVLRLQLAPQIRLESDVGGRGAGAGAAFELDY